VHTRTTAGQATIEYIAAIALVVAIFVVAGPAVGAPNVGALVVKKIHLALCVVGGDICSPRMAREAGLQPCPLKSNQTGHAASVTVFSIEIGGGATLTVTERSDGTVGIVRGLDGSAGAAVGEGPGVDAGPIRFELSADGAARDRFQVARAWEFKDRATADRFLEHAVLNTVNEKDFPAAWHSLEGGVELQASVGAAIGHSGAKTSADLVGAAGSAGAVLGGRVARDGAVTLYQRVTLEGELTWPMMPTVGSGKFEAIAEYTFNRDGPRELVLRMGVPSKLGQELTETVGRLDLRDPQNLAAARAVLDAALPWPPDAFTRARALNERIRTHGTFEITRSAVEDDSRGASAHGAEGIKFGAAWKGISVHRRFISAVAYTGGPFARRRYDCQVVAQG
jgi:hypothetical protein